MPNTTPHALDVTDEDVARALDTYYGQTPGATTWDASELSTGTGALLRRILEADRAALASARPREELTPLTTQRAHYAALLDRVAALLQAFARGDKPSAQQHEDAHAAFYDVGRLAHALVRPTATPDGPDA